MRTLRPLAADELPDYLAQATSAFRGEAIPRAVFEARAAFLDPDSTLGVFEDGRLVATAGTESMPLAVPGGHVRAAGIGRVTVLPTHRRQGIMTEILRRQLGEARERGEPAAILFASEGGIYGRFGFGIATYESHGRVSRHRGAFRGPVSVAGLRLTTLADALDEVRATIDRATRGVPGAIARSDGWWRYLASEPQPGPGGGVLDLVVRAEGDGFVAYERSIESSIPSLDGGSLQVLWLFAATPAAYAALWRYCLDVDLMDEVRARSRPVDEPLRHLLADPRALETRVWDGLWLRLVDVEAALAGRTYASAGLVRLAVEDTFCPWNTGTYEVGDGGCRRVELEPDLVLAADALGACYLGGNRFTTLVRAGRLEERHPGAAERADALFAAPTPWCPFHF